MTGFVRPEKKREGTKFLFYGTAGSGKTPCGLSFPNIALIDSDSGSNFYDLDNVRLTSNALSYNDLKDDLDQLEMEDDLFNEIDTFVVDSITRLHDTMSIAMNKVAERRAINKGREAESEVMSFREYGKMKTYYKEFYGKMVGYAKQGKNLVFIAEQKDKTDNGANGEIRKIGVMPDAQKDIEYDFDVVVRTFQKKVTVDGKTKLKPMGIVEKDRTGTFSVGEEIEKPRYELWEEAVKQAQKGKRRNKDEIKTVSDAVKEEELILDDGEKLRSQLNNMIRNLSDENKAIAKEKLIEKFGTHNTNKIDDVSMLKEAYSIIKNIK